MKRKRRTQARKRACEKEEELEGREGEEGRIGEADGWKVGREGGRQERRRKQ